MQRTVIFVEKQPKSHFEGAAHRDIEINITVRCNLQNVENDSFYKYYAALPLL